MRYLITGADGFIGRNIVKRLGDRADVTVVLKDRRYEKLIPDSYSIVTGDISRPEFTSGLPAADIVLHLAGLSFPPAGEKDPELMFGINTNGTLNMLEYCRKKGAGKLVFFSTGQIYGKITRSPVSEDHPVNPVSVYGASKAAADMLVQMYSKNRGVRATVLRLFNIFGPGQFGDFVIPTIIRQMINGGRVVMGNPRPVRDFLYVDDLVELILKVSTDRKSDNGAFNVGSGKGTAIKDLVGMLEKISGSPKEIVVDKSRFRKGDLMRLVVDISKVNRTTGWKPAVSLEDGLRRTYAYYREHGVENLYS